jgi:gluconate 2-dehydrogenase gamma chain
MADRRNDQAPSDSRRRFLKYSGTAIGGAVVGGVIGGVITGGFRKNPQEAPAPAPEPVKPAPAFDQAPMYFNQLQLQLTEAAAERIYPKDETGPGAAELGVAFFIDHQMASPWGINAREYRMGPFVKGEVTQGDYQIIRRNELFTMGLQAMEDASKQKFNKSFTDLADEEKDAILTSLEKGEVTVINDVTGKTFFNLLRRLTIEGVYSDPMYGGNKNMDGWRMRKYPGNQMAYTNIMDKGEFVVMEPRSLHDHFAAH